MLTRCPACETRFRVTAEQLKARSGRVRCGACQHVFNALDSLIEEPMLVIAPLTPEAQPRHVPPFLPGTEAEDAAHPEALIDEIAVLPAPTPEPVEETELEELHALERGPQEASIPEPVAAT